MIKTDHLSLNKQICYLMHYSIFTGGGGVIRLLITVPNVFIFVGKQHWGILLHFLNWFIKLSGQTFQPLILIYRRGNFVYHHWECTSIYRPLSYPFRSLVLLDALEILICLDQIPQSPPPPKIFFYLK